MDIFNIIQLARMDEFITIIDIKSLSCKNIIESMNQMMQKTVSIP